MKSLGKISGIFTCCVALMGTLNTVSGAETPKYLDSNAPIEERIDDLLGRLTLEEKVSLLHADSKFAIGGVSRLGIPRRWTSDGPHGVREDIGPDDWKPSGRTDDFATAFPSGICLAATWNPDLAYTQGEAIGQEARARNKDIMNGPGLNILRTPVCGRNFEYLGEDPFLAGRIAVGVVKGEQSQDVSACVKHFAANNQEMDRFTVNVEMDERALREIYLPAFKAAVQEGGVWAVMGAYNQLRGQFCCENDYLLNQILKNEWGFKGLVISDWGGAHDTKNCALNGLDLEMGTDKKYEDYFLAQPYLEKLKKGEFLMAGLDDKVRRNLRVMFATRIFDSTRKPGSLNTRAHQLASRRVAEEGIVLLKNEKNFLPLDSNKIKSIAVIGTNAVTLHAHGGASSGIKAFYEISVFDGILRRVGSQCNVTYSEGYRTNADPQVFKRAIAAAKAADVVIYVGGVDHDSGDCEGEDRATIKLPHGQEELIQKIVATNPKTIVVLEGTIVEMGSWLKKVPAVLQAWYPGMEGGNALAGVLFGEVNPSGKLPCTMPKQLADSPAHSIGEYPGKKDVVRYNEGILVGYRWFDTRNIEPLFPFGHGLSYTRFDYSNLKLVETKKADGSLLSVEFEITNAGQREGAEVAQIYVQDVQASLTRPIKELKGFRKVSVKPGEKISLSVPLDHSAFAYYDPAQKGWVAEAGEFKILVGSSSRDIRLTGPFNLSRTTLQKDVP